MKERVEVSKREEINLNRKRTFVQEWRRLEGMLGKYEEFRNILTLLH